MQLAVFRRFRVDGSGGLSLLAALSLPVMVLGVAATVEYGNLTKRKIELQKAVDAAALTAAARLRVTQSSPVVQAVARDVVAVTAPPPSGTSTDVDVQLTNRGRGVEVSATENVKSVVGRVLTLPFSTLRVSAAAQIVGTTKLCLLTLDPKQKEALFLKKDSLITAPDCAIYSNSLDPKGMKAESNARATASLICAAGGVENKGAILSPAPITDCPVTPDPLAKLPRPGTGTCTGLEKPLDVSASRFLSPGTYCKGLTISGTAQANLAPGIYVINDGPLIVKDQASLIGENVGFFFTGNEGGSRFDPNTTINLTAPKDGAMAGLLFFEDRTVSASVVAPPAGPRGSPPPPPYGSAPMRQYRITSNNAPTLLGTIYLPAGRLIIDSATSVAGASAYTVVVTRQLDLNSGPNLTLNTDYGATDIPVPDGVGPKTGPIVLSQ